MPRKHKLEMPDYSVIIAIEDDQSVALDVSAHPDIGAWYVAESSR